MITIKVVKNSRQMAAEKDFVAQAASIYNTKAENLQYLDYFLTNFFKPHKQNFLVIAKDGDKIISIVRFQYQNGLDNLDMKDKVLITGLQTLEEYKRQGIATKVMEYGIKYASKKTPKYVISLFVSKDNEQAFNLYKKLGFVVKEQDQEIWTSGFNPQYQYFMRYAGKGKFLDNKNTINKEQFLSK